MAQTLGGGWTGKGSRNTEGTPCDLPTLRGGAAGLQSNDWPGRSREGTTWVTWPLGTPTAPNLGELFPAWLVAEKALQELGCLGEPPGWSLLPQRDLLWLKLQDHADRTGCLTWENKFL